MNKILNLLKSSDKGDNEIGSILLVESNKELFKKELRRNNNLDSDKAFYLDSVALSVLLGEVIRQEVYFSERFVQENFPEEIQNFYKSNIIDDGEDFLNET